uniref:Uncharacterized protein n=1 Tax=Oryza meridionalis TaxID=40149 RepID=A0A0E0CH56_9ORYZ
MGSKLSCIYRPDSDIVVESEAPAAPPPPARVIAADGSLRELPASPCVAVVSDVLGGGDGDAASFFVCNSDALYFDDRPLALSPGEPLRPGELYFVLPRAMLGRPLSSADMGRLAVRASLALAGERPQRRRRHRRGGGGKKQKKKVHVMPAQAQGRDEDDGDGDVDGVFNEKLNEQTLGVFAVFLSPARGAAPPPASPAAARSPLKRALSLVEEEA